MATLHEQYENISDPYLYDIYTTSDEEDEQEPQQKENENEQVCKEYISTPSYIYGHAGLPIFGNGPRILLLKEWNRLFPLLSAISLFVDPLFFFTLSISQDSMCLFIDGWFVVALTLLRSMTDAFHLCNMWLEFRADNHRQSPGSTVHNRNISGSSVQEYLKGKFGFYLYVFVLLPLPQVVIWVAIPQLLKKGETTAVMTLLVIMFLIQYLLKVYHAVCLMRRMLFEYIFGTTFWGFGLNIIAIFVASHAVGACWYLLGIQRTTECLMEQCTIIESCRLSALTCEKSFFFTKSYQVKDNMRLLWRNNNDARSFCLQGGSDHYDYGAFNGITNLVSNYHRSDKILYPMFWGIMMLCTYGNLTSTTDWLECLFMMLVTVIGLVLVTMLIGNIKVFLIASTSKKYARKIETRNVEWWMERRNLPQGFRQRVRNYERQRWAAMRGVNESDMIQNLPEGMRRDIKYYLCLDLVRQVPLFQHMDSLVLENICDRVKSVVFTKGEIITKEGDPVQRMLFIVRGHLQCRQVIRNGARSFCMLGPGNFSGDELLSWCMRKPFIERLPPSSSMLITLDAIEAFALEADDVRYVTQHFRVNDNVKMIARYYSPGWRTWAAVSIQLAWFRYRHRLTLSSLSFIRPRRPLSRSASEGEDKLRIYTALLTSPKPLSDNVVPQIRRSKI